MEYIATRPIVDLCLVVERKSGTCLYRKWWDQPALDTLGICAGLETKEGGGETGLEESEVGGEGE